MFVKTTWILEPETFQQEGGSKGKRIQHDAKESGYMRFPAGLSFRFILLSLPELLRSFDSFIASSSHLRVVMLIEHLQDEKVGCGTQQPSRGLGSTQRFGNPLNKKTHV